MRRNRNADQRRRLPKPECYDARVWQSPLYNMFDDVEIVGFEEGYKGLMYADYQI